MPNCPTILPKYEAEVQLLIEIEENIDRLEFEYDKTLFDIDKETLSDKSKTPLKRGETIKITCLKDLDSDKDIKIYAYPKEIIPVTDKMGTKLGGKLYQFLSRKLAGRIIVLQNDSRVRKKEKIVFIPVKTNVLGLKDSTGSFTTSDIQNLCYYMYQSLIIPITEVSPNILDLSLNEDFKVIIDRNTGIEKYGKYIYDFNSQYENNPQNHNTTYIDKGIWEDASNFFSEVRNLFFTDEDINGKLKNEKYRDYQLIFLMEVTTYDGTPGQVERVGEKNVILFNSMRYPTTMAHEVYHSLGLFHTHREETPIEETQRKYIYQKRTTTNLMSYNGFNRKSLWRWQWYIINPNIKER